MIAVRCSVLDLGSNSFHLLVADLDGHRLTPVLREREMLHLGRTVATHGAIPTERRQAAIATAGDLADLARRSGAHDGVVVATSALREASNGAEVIADLAAATGARIRVLDGPTEARLVYRGVRAAISVRDEPLLVLDLGGGSLELAIGSGPRAVWAGSVPLGASRLAARVDTDPIAAHQADAIAAAVDAELRPLVATIRTHAPARAVAVGGVVRALARLGSGGERPQPGSGPSQLPLTRRRLAELRGVLTDLDLAARLEVPGVKARRADHLHVAAIVLLRTLERLQLEAVTVTDWGLREGLLLDAYGPAAV